jgi:hypothetical protein
MELDLDPDICNHPPQHHADLQLVFALEDLHGALHLQLFAHRGLVPRIVAPKH